MQIGKMLLKTYWRISGDLADNILHQPTSYIAVNLCLKILTSIARSTKMNIKANVFRNVRNRII